MDQSTGADHSECNRTPLRTFARRTSNDPAATAITDSVSTPASASDAVRINPSSYGSSRPARVRPVEPTYSVVHGSGTASAASRFPTLVQMDIAASPSNSSAIVPLPHAAAPSEPPVVAASHSADSSPFQPLPVFTPSPPTAAKQSPGKHPSQPNSCRVRASLCTFIEEALFALSHRLDQTKHSGARLNSSACNLSDSNAASESIHRSLDESSTQVQWYEPGEQLLDANISIAASSVTASSEVDHTQSIPPPQAALSQPPEQSPQQGKEVDKRAPTSSSSSPPPRGTSLANRPAFVVSTSLPSQPLSLGLMPAPATAPRPPSTESYQSRVARESEARKAAKEQEKAESAAAAAAAAAAEAERERKRREAIKQQLAVSKAAKEEAARLKAAAEEKAAKAARIAAKEAAAKKKADKEEMERAKKAREDEEAAAAAAAVAAAEAKRKKKRATATAADSEQKDAVMPAPVEPAPPLSGPVPNPLTDAPEAPVASSRSPDEKGKKKRAAPPPPVPKEDFSSQTDFPPDEEAASKYIANRFKLSPAEMEEEKRENAELANLSLQDQVAKLSLDLRYCKLRIKGLDEETAGQLSRLKEMKNELSRQSFIIREQNAELNEWRSEGAKMVSTGLSQTIQHVSKQINLIRNELNPDGSTAASSSSSPSSSSSSSAAAAYTETDNSVAPVASASSPTSLLSKVLSELMSSGASLPTSILHSLPSPPSIVITTGCGTDPAFLNWLRLMVSEFLNLERRKKEAERVTEETIQKGRMAELNLIDVWKENERLNAQVQVLLKRIK